MKRPFTLGDLVRFKTSTGQYIDGLVIHRIVEKRQPTIFLVESMDRRRAFRLETELQLIAAAEDREPHELGGSGFESALAVPAFARAGADD